MHSLPLYLETVREFEGKIRNCSRNLPSKLSSVEAPPYERYFDSDLPVVSRELIAHCVDVVAELSEHFRDRKRYPHHVVENAAGEAAFKQLRSNMSEVVRELDDLRRNTYKFVCINDNMDPHRVEDNVRVQSFLVDFYESILPVPSSFELPPEFRNKFAHIDDLRRWQFFRDLLRYITYTCLALLAVTGIGGFFKVDIWAELKVRVFDRILVFLAKKQGRTLPKQSV